IRRIEVLLPFFIRPTARADVNLAHISPFGWRQGRSPSRAPHWGMCTPAFVTKSFNCVKILSLQSFVAFVTFCSFQADVSPTAKPSDGDRGRLVMDAGAADVAVRAPGRNQDSPWTGF